MPLLLDVSFRQQAGLCLLACNTEEVFLDLCNILMLLLSILRIAVLYTMLLRIQA
jgi:hypothetical protein